MVFADIGSIFSADGKKQTLGSPAKTSWCTLGAGNKYLRHGREGRTDSLQSVYIRISEGSATLPDQLALSGWQEHKDPETFRIILDGSESIISPSFCSFLLG